MKRFVLYALTLLTAIAALALAVDCANVWLICSSTGNSAYKMKRLYENPKPDEIAIVGSSRACGNFVPSLISSKCFNYGIKGMAMGETMSALEVLKLRETEAPVIVNLDPWGNFGNHIVGDYRLAPQSGRLSWVESVPGVRFFGALRKNLVAMISARCSVTCVIDCGAELLKNSRTEAEWAAINSKLADTSFCCNGEDRQRLFSVLKAFSPRKVYVVVCPCSAAWMSHFSGKQSLMEFLSELENLENVTVLNYFWSKDFSDADFTDPTHFNFSGARKFSQLLKSQLTRLTK